MKIEIVIWILCIVIVSCASALGFLAVWPVVIVVVPSLVYALGCGMAFVMAGHSALRINLYRFLCAVLIALVGLTQFPMRLGFLASKASLAEVAHQVGIGKPPAFPVRAGLYIIQSATRNEDGTICLWTEVKRGNKIGFVCGDNLNHTNLWSVQNLDCVWWFVVLD